jgi:hypothetical protein
MSSPADLNDAVKGAKLAFTSWSKIPIKERVTKRYRFFHSNKQRKILREDAKKNFAP